MMKKAIYLIWVLLIAAACQNRKVDCGCDGTDRRDINVVIHWEAGVSKPGRGMMINLFPLGGSPAYGMAQLPVDGGPIRLTDGAAYFCYCYDYYASTVYFRNEYSMTELEAYCAPTTRTTYSRAFPNETTVAQPDNPFWVDRVERFPVDGNDLHFYPENVTERFTFEIRGLTGAQYITATRGAIGGMSGSYFMYDGSLSSSPVTVLFDAAKQGDTRITGSFCTFGAIPAEINKFTIEILYPSESGGIVQGTWDVTDQVRAAQHIPGIPDIIIDNNGVIPPIVPDDNPGSFFEADVNDWNNIYIPLG